MKGKLIVVSGPSGAGKSTVTKMIRKSLNIPLAISATTRSPRVGEEDKVDYYFMKKEDFENGIKNNDFLEYACVHENYYGTLKSEVENKLMSGENVILEIDVQGGMQIKEKFNEAVLVFFKAPSVEELEKRLRFRNTDSDEIINLRLKNAIKELEYEKFYDLSIINSSIEKSFEELKKIIEN